MYEYTHAHFSVPSQPINVTTRDVTNTSVIVMWQEPNHPNGIIEGYRLYFMHKNFTDVRTIRQPAKKIEFFLSGLGKRLFSARAGHFRYFCNVFNNKNDFIAFFIKLITYFCTSPI